MSDALPSPPVAMSCIAAPLVWVGGISVLVLFEKVSCYGRAISNAAGAILVDSGLLLAAFG
jgi:predicted metal-binding membrane protein